jgi:hypothetical protein
MTTTTSTTTATVVVVVTSGRTFQDDAFDRETLHPGMEMVVGEGMTMTTRRIDSAVVRRIPSITTILDGNGRHPHHLPGDDPPPHRRRRRRGMILNHGTLPRLITVIVVVVMIMVGAIPAHPNHDNHHLPSNDPVDRHHHVEMNEEIDGEGVVGETVLTQTIIETVAIEWVVLLVVVDDSTIHQLATK